MDFSVDLVLRQRWNDPRLSFNVSGYEEELSFLKADAEYIERIWHPDVFFPTARSGLAHDITVPNRMTRIYPNGDVLHTQRYSLVLACPMNLVKYPFDIQQCTVPVGSYSYTEDMLKLTWQEHAVHVNEELSLPKFTLANYELINCQNIHATGNFSCLKAKFVFTRQVRYHVVEAYVPSTLLVMASWLAFWIDASSVPGRVSLSVTTMLTTVAQSKSVKDSLPPVSYLKAIDIWLGACISFVFAALVEYAIVNSLLQLEQREAKLNKASATSDSDDGIGCCGASRQKRRRSAEKCASDAANAAILGPGSRMAKKSCVRKWTPRSQSVDKFSRVGFPVIFFIFVIIYCAIYAI